MTIFDNVSDILLAIYREAGFDYTDYNYINVFRWLWDKKHCHPSILSFVGDTQNKTYVSLYNPHNIGNKIYRNIVNSYDEAIIDIVNYIANNKNIYLT